MEPQVSTVSIPSPIIVTTQAIPETPKKTFGNDQLMSALYGVFDLFSRSITPFFLLGDTAYACYHNKSLFGDHVEVGIRYLEYNERSLGIMEAFKHAESMNEHEIRYDFDGIPVIVKVVHDDSPMFSSPGNKMFQREYFNLPNPFDEYWKLKDSF